MKKPARTIHKGLCLNRGFHPKSQIVDGSFKTIPNPPCPLVPYVAGGSDSFQSKI